MDPLNIVLVDDHRVLMEGLKSLLEAEGLTIVGQGANGLEAVQLVEQLLPDVVMMDLMMPAMNGLEAARLISQRVPETRIIILSMHDDEVSVMRALRSGAMAYVVKDSSADEVIHAIESVMKGKRYLSPILSDRIVDMAIHSSNAGGLDPLEALTDRERIVFQLVAEGQSNLAIAEQLSISPRTVETHRSNLMQKLGLNSQTEVVKFAIKHGIVE